MSFQRYYEIAKPGMVYGNLVPVVCAFLFASGGFVLWPLLIATVIGIGLVVASACVFNNVIDGDIDGRMTRTKHRAMVEKEIPTPMAIAYGVVLGLVGFAVLAVYVNTAAVIAAAVGFFFYVVMYSLWGKRQTVWGTEIGSISGAIPPVVGYVAVTGSFDLAAALLFAIMALWQMPHFYAIAIRRADEYAAAKIPVLPLVRGVRAAKWQMLAYILAFTIVAPHLTLFGFSTGIYLAVCLMLSFAWLLMAVRGLFIPDKDAKTIQWAKQMFLMSLVIMIVLFITIALTPSM